MFIFYYAVLAEVSPPTALARVRLRRDHRRRRVQDHDATWKYTLPAFLVPFAFVLTAER